MVPTKLGSGDQNASKEGHNNRRFFSWNIFYQGIWNVNKCAPDSGVYDLNGNEIIETSPAFTSKLLVEGFVWDPPDSRGCKHIHLKVAPR